jgi:hypothetical protein
MAASLARYGVTPNKAARERAAEDVADKAAFWRGYIDGDGCYSCKSHAQINVVGSEALLLQLKGFFVGRGAPIRNASIGHKPGIRQISIYGPKAAICCRILYARSTVFLPRKKRVADNIIDRYEKRRAPG